MQYKKVQDGYLVVFSRGENIHEGLTRLVAEEKIASGAMTGIGAVMNTRLGFYHLDRKSYDEKKFVPEAELVNLTGNITWFGEKPVVHAHVTIGLPDFTAAAGHLFEAECAVTVEISIQTRKEKVVRQFSPEIGLNLQTL